MYIQILKIREKESYIKKFKKIFSIRNVSYSSIILNSVSIILSIFYLVIPIYSIIWDIFGVILSLTLFNDLLLVYITSHKINKLSRIGNKLNMVCYVYLIFIMVAFISLLLGNLLISSIISNDLIAKIGAYSLIYISYFGVLIFAIFIALFNIKHLKNEILWNREFINREYEIIKNRRNIKRLKRILTIISRITFIIGMIFAIVIVFGSFEIVTTFVAIISAQFGIFFSFIFLANTILFIKLKRIKWTRRKYYRNAIIGVLVSFLLLLPLLMSHLAVYNAEKNFSTFFGENWKSSIPEEVNQFFLKTPFTTPEYFLGNPPKECKVESQILFYNEEGINLYFDAYMPLDGEKNLPGENSTIIRIHGGAWISGDKGTFNMLQMNKYFAAQGYVVFDIQYGLCKTPISALDPTTPKYKIGDFDIDDMVRHIGIFTKYLSNHSDDYGANLNSVFLSGGSSGGHLTCAVSLAMASGLYPDLFSQNLTIKGYIPFYPANGLLNFFGIGGKEEFINPEKMIQETSPPCLIFQGTHDIINYFGIANNFRKTYLAKDNKECSIIWMPLGGHACDFYFSGYYNQIFLYYMERFLYLYH